MKVGVYYNKNYLAENKPYLELIHKRFSEKNVDCIVVNGVEDVAGVDVLFVLGGDGTILTMASECAVHGVKIVGVNYGRIGFLAEFERERLDEAISLVCSGKYSVQMRSMLEIVYAGKKYLALNDLVIQRNTGGADFCNTVNLHAEIDGETVDNFSSDGIIVSTPTGSTAYSLSAGGSVLSPEINAFILTPICAHSLHSRPIVFGDGSTLTVKPLNVSQQLVLIVDGKVVGAMDSESAVTVRKSAYRVGFITKNDRNFFNKLLLKLSKWSK